MAQKNGMRSLCSLNGNEWQSLSFGRSMAVCLSLNTPWSALPLNAISWAHIS